MSFRASVLTLYPEMFPGALGLSLAGRALDAGTWSLDLVQIRDFASDKHRTVDDTPAGGGAGMVMRADILAKAIDRAAPAGDLRPRLLMSPRGRPLTQAKVRELAAGSGAVIVGGRFEGPRVKASLQTPAGDWITNRADGTYRLDVRLTLKTDDGALILVTYNGIAQATATGASLRTAPLFETGDSRYVWLTRLQAVGVGERVGTAVKYDIYALK